VLVLKFVFNNFPNTSTDIYLCGDVTALLGLAYTTFTTVAIQYYFSVYN